jgi:glycerophosphoryl diester phosphodiesterase
VSGWLRRLPVAHRGLHDAAAGRPENSLAAFEAAAGAGYAMECDLQLAKDGVAMVFHDAKLERLTQASGALGGHSAKALQVLRLLGTDEPIPTLAELLARIDGKAPILIELKHDVSPVGPLEEAAWRELKRYRGPYAVQSFDPDSVAWFRDHAPQALRGQVTGDWRRFREGDPPALANAWAALSARPQFLAWSVHRLPHWAPALARRFGLPLLSWTVRTPEDLARARACGANPIFENVRP